MREIKFIGSNEKTLVSMNKEYGWSLNLKELLMVKDYFEKLKREPTRAEIETIAQTWSEHCKHKTFSGPVEFIWKDRSGKIKMKKKFDNLFKETIVYATKKLNKKYCLSVFKDNAGIIELYPGSKWGICFKAETHNHPCAIEPYGGAETGVGGVIRDILGVGMGAKPVIDTDIFCFAYPDKKYDIGKGFLTPHNIISGVVSGVRDYGNKMGIPTANGAVVFDDSYIYNPLVYVGSAGLIPRDKINKKVVPQSLIVVIGGRTGRDGIGGATFSSADIEEETSSSHVQIGNAINEKKVLDVLLKARDKGLYTAVTDCGAGGFSSAIGELASDCGAEVWLDKALLKDENIEPWEIWVSESQERMVLCVPEKNLNKLKEICEMEECEFCVVGRFTDTKKLEVYHKKDKIIDLDMKFLHAGLPQIAKKAVYKERKTNYNSISLKHSEIPERFKKIISDLNVCSKRSIVEQYDHEVIGQTVIKPFCSMEQRVPSDSAVIWAGNVTGENNHRGFAVSCGINSRISKISPYLMSYYVVDEAVRNLVCVGADITRGAILDNFCSANPNYEDVMGDFTASAISASKAALDISMPYISGKDSFYNQTAVKNRVYKIPTTLLISAIAPVEDVRNAVSSDIKSEGNPIYVIGEFKKGMGGSVYRELFKGDDFVSSIDLKKNRKYYLKIMESMRKKHILSAHDVSDGGFLTAVLEMALCGRGVEINIGGIKDKYKVSDAEALFGECGSKIILEVDMRKEKEFINFMREAPMLKVGKVVQGSSFILTDKGNIVFKEDVLKLREIWERKII